MKKLPLRRKVPVSFWFVFLVGPCIVVDLSLLVWRVLYPYLMGKIGDGGWPLLLALGAQAFASLLSTWTIWMTVSPFLLYFVEEGVVKPRFLRRAVLVRWSDIYGIGATRPRYQMPTGLFTCALHVTTSGS